jgi:hypothetical protein
MSMIRFASASLLALGLITAVGACGSTAPPKQSDLAPFRGDWETVAEWPFDGSASSINIGGALDSDNFANRGNIEVYYIDTPNIIIQMRKFTFAADAAGASEDYAKMLPWMNVGSKVIPEELDPEATCMYTDPETGEAYWQDGCGVHLYYDGQSQKLRVGADMRVYLPAGWEGLLNVTTEDNVAELEDYPDRGDVTIIGLRGSADIQVDSGIVNVKLADGIEPVPACTEAFNQACADVGWDTMHPDCTACTEFGRVRVTTRGELPIQGTVDAPNSLWVNVTMKNSAPGLTPSSDPLCEATIDCDDFGGCSWIDNDPNKPFDRRAELNKPSASLEGLGYNINVESGACVSTTSVEGPDDFTMPASSLRGELHMCTGCVDGTIPNP